jgi:hypothetical protein
VVPRQWELQEEEEVREEESLSRAEKEQEGGVAGVVGSMAMVELQS